MVLHFQPWLLDLPSALTAPQTREENHGQYTREIYSRLGLENSILHFCSYTMGANSVAWPHLIAREAGKCNLVMCPGRKENRFWWTASNLSHTHPHSFLFFNLAKAEFMEYFYIALYSLACQDNDLSGRRFTNLTVQLMGRDLIHGPFCLWYLSISIFNQVLQS